MAKIGINNKYIIVLLLIIVAVSMFIFNDTLTYNMSMVEVPFYIPRKNTSGPTIINGVPLVIYHSWKTNRTTKVMKENIYSLLEANPEFDYYLYSDEACYKFIKDNFHNDVAEAFNTLKPGAYKSDLWRYCVLYINGGVYIDIKFNTMAPLIDTIKRSPIVYVNDIDSIPNKTTQCFYNAFMISPPNNIVLKDCIDEIVDSCKNKLYRKNSLDITGPCLLGRIIEKHNKDFRNNNKYKFSESNQLARIGYIYYEDRIILKSYPEYRIEQELNEKVGHYSELYQKKNVYNL